MQIIHLGEIKIINTGNNIFVVFPDSVAVFKYNNNILPYVSTSLRDQASKNALHDLSISNPSKAIKESEAKSWL
jgi:hypothetical protein